jgi:hypothetical protein
MIKKAKDFTQEEKETFVEWFYFYWDSEVLGEEDLDSPFPWGFPWFNNADQEFDVSDLKEEAYKYYHENYDCIESDCHSCDCGYYCNNCI